MGLDQITDLKESEDVPCLKTNVCKGCNVRDS